MRRTRHLLLGLPILVACGEAARAPVAPIDVALGGSDAGTSTSASEAGAVTASAEDAGGRTDFPPPAEGEGFRMHDDEAEQALAGGTPGGGIGLGSFGHGAGTGTGGGNAWTSSDGGAPRRTTPTLRQGKTEVNGRLPPEVIQRVVRQNFGRYRLCYENALRAKPDLSGTVRVKFVIERDGSVKDPKDDKSDVKDSGLVACVVKGFANLSFPQPEGGIVTVVYPIVFAPPDGATPAPKASSSAAPKPPPKK